MTDAVVKPLPPSTKRDLEKKNEARRQNGLNPIPITVRVCLQCNQSFESAGNRTCGCMARSANSQITKIDFYAYITRNGKACVAMAMPDFEVVALKRMTTKISTKLHGAKRFNAGDARNQSAPPALLEVTADIN